MFPKKLLDCVGRQEKYAMDILIVKNCDRVFQTTVWGLQTEGSVSKFSVYGLNQASK